VMEFKKCPFICHVCKPWSRQKAHMIYWSVTELIGIVTSHILSVHYLIEHRFLFATDAACHSGPSAFCKWAIINEIYLCPADVCIHIQPPLCRWVHSNKVTFLFTDFLPCSSRSNRRFGERIVSVFRVPHVRIPHLCYPGITVNQPLHRRILFMVEEQCLQGYFHGGINYRCLLGLLPCSSRSNRSLTEHIVSIFRVP
jgi:hypothetical protein